MNIISLCEVDYALLSFILYVSIILSVFNFAEGSRIPRPMRNWEEGSLSSELLKAVYKAGYKKPSPIQMAAIPIGLQQQDVIGIAETGQNAFFN